MKIRSCCIYCVNLLLISVNSKLLNYGEVCDTYAVQRDSTGGIIPSFCKRELNLVCSGKTCVCKSNYVFDKDFEMCVGRPGAICTPSEANENSPCVHHTTCQTRSESMHAVPVPLIRIVSKLLKMSSEPNFCMCNKGFEYVALSKPECRQYLGFGDTCIRNSRNVEGRCDVGANLVCNNDGTCDCRTPKMHYSKELKQCVSPLGARCVGSGATFGECDKNAICSTFLAKFRVDLHLRTGRPVSYNPESLAYGTCVCTPGYTKTDEGLCAGSYQVACKKNSDCNANNALACIDGICQCENGMTQTFSVSDETCYVRQGYACSEKSGPDCTENSMCKKGLCVCKDTHSETGEGRCMLGHGSKCTSSLGKEECNHFQGLACMGSKCECFDRSLKWNAKGKICAAKEGQPCGEISFTQNIELKVDPLYPFAVAGNASSIPYAVGCENGLACTRDQVHHKWHRCKKLAESGDDKEDADEEEEDDDE